MKGYIYNNLGIVHFFSFIEKSVEITDVQQGGLEKVGVVMAHLEKGIHNLKQSICHFEDFQTKFRQLDSNDPGTVEKREEEVSLSLIQQKLFIDEFFDPKNQKEIIPKDFK